MSPEDYRAALLARETAQLCYTRLAPLADAVITLSCPGPAPYWPGDVPGEPLAPRPTGDAVFNYPSSMLFAPAVTMPLMSVSGMPVGVQLMGQPHDDARVTAHGTLAAGDGVSGGGALRRPGSDTEVGRQRRKARLG